MKQTLSPQIRPALALLVSLTGMIGLGIDDTGAQEHWNQYRGSHGNGRCDEAELPLEFDDKQKGAISLRH